MNLSVYLSALVLFLPWALASPTGPSAPYEDTAASSSSAPSVNVGGQEGTQKAAAAVDGASDLQLLNLALHASHLGSALYTYTLDTYTDEDFINQGTKFWAPGRFEQIGEHHQAHAKWLENTITAAGGMPVAPCEYHFDFAQSQLAGFFQMSEAVEQIAMSTLQGLLGSVENKEYLEAIALMLGVNARHTSWVMSAITKLNPFNGAFETPLSSRQAHTLLSSYVTSCPSSNAAFLPANLDLYNALDIPLNITAGSPVKLSFDDRNVSDDIFAAFVFGAGKFVVPLRTVEVDNNRLGYHALPTYPVSYQPIKANQPEAPGYWVTVPEDLRGQGGVYVYLTTSPDGEEDGTVAGPVLLSFPYDNVTDEDDIDAAVESLEGFNMLIVG
ncbi:ferritin-like domain-containing protein [Coprinopsis sp. MPI-PUGE-AT-0042]|nr:ferritin-like domain-containing protein [Coprinopsis sp. MPI-PUGE-AT-0042]